MARVLSSYTPAGTRKGTKARKSEKQASAGLRAKAKEIKPKTKSKPKKNTLINRIKEDWSQPLGGWNEGPVAPAYDKYPYGSLTGRKKSKKK